MDRNPIDRRALMAMGAGLAAIGAAPAAGAATGTACDGSGAWIPSDAFVRELPHLMRIGRVPGLAIAVVEDRRVAWSQVFGVKNVVTGEPVTGDTLFEAASMTKPVFAYLVMQLVDEGLLELDRPLVDYRRLDYAAADPRLDRIRVRDVLRHSSGLPNWTREALATESEPGGSYTYSGEAMIWLQLIVEQVAGAGLEQVARARLLDPAGIASSSFAWDDRIAKAAVHGHSDDMTARLPAQPTREMGDKLLAVAKRWGRPIASWRYEDMVRAMREADPATRPLPNDFILNAAGGLLATAPDYARFMILMMDGRRRAEWEVGAESRKAMLSPQLEVRGRDIARGLGWELERHRDALLFQHGGSNGGIFKTFGVGDAARGKAIVIFTNGANGTLLAQRIVRAAAGLELHKFLV